jgi:hypothetical protein
MWLTMPTPAKPSTRPPAPPPAVGSPLAEYDLAIDSQVEKFVESKQKLTYFLITASVAVMAFTINFFVDHATSGGRVGAVTTESALVVGAALAALTTAGLALLTLRFEHRSYRLHLGYRYERKTWEMLNDKQRRHWTAINKWAARLLVAAFAFLFAEIALAVAFFVVFVW